MALSLKDRELAGDTITVHVRYTNFVIKSHQSKLPNAINTPDEIYTIAVKLFDELWNQKELNLVGVNISGLRNIRFKQVGLF